MRWLKICYTTAGQDSTTVCGGKLHAIEIMFLKLAVGLLTLLNLSACAPEVPLLGRLGGSPGSLPEPVCRAAAAERQLGKRIDDEVADSARAEAGAMRARIVRYGGIPTTANTDPQRLNIEVDDTGRIRRLRCG